ncbi:MAG TPA: ABC transporter substrate-binding protein [Candidatus Bathyarchaeia archaeon]|nr:ABC transporter substrate-binding protein [Candidatus Bathyarchaeia archaeon]
MTASLSRIGLLLLAILFLPMTVEAQPQGKVVRIGLLDVGASNPSSEARWKALRDRLRELGYVEGQHVSFEQRWGNGQMDRVPGLAAELVNLKVDIIVTAGGEAALASKQVSSAIPIVTATCPDPVRLGLVTSLARPGGNVTGVISLNADLAGKRLELLKQLTPRATRVAILRDPDNRSSEFSVLDAERVAKSLAVVVQSVDVKGPKEFDAAFQTMKRARAEAVILGVNTPFIAHRQRIAELAVSQRLPMMAPTKEYAEAGALVSYGTDYPEQFRRAAAYVDKILKGAKPADLPIEQPTKFELVVNLKTAKAIGLTVPQSVLGRADEVIQ